MPGNAVQMRPGRHRPRTQRGGQSLLHLPQAGRKFFGRRSDQFGRFAGRQRANVGGQIGQRDVDFVADRRDDRNSRSRNRPHDRLLVERPQVFQTAAAARDDQAIDRAGSAG